MKNYMHILTNSKLFVDINESDISSVLNCISYKISKFSNKQTIFCEGQTINTIGLVLSGSVLITQTDFWGNQSIISRFLPGELFGEGFAFGDNPPLSVNVISADDSEIMFFDCNKITTVCQFACGFHNTLIKNLLAIIAKNNVTLAVKLQCLSQRSTRGKLLSYLSNESKKQGHLSFSVPYNRQQLADYLSVDRSAMSNELSKMCAEGILEYHKNLFKLNAITD
jgi:CRP-like cAMP-binding protein